jgi:hypothetical protein
MHHIIKNSLLVVGIFLTSQAMAKSYMEITSSSTNTCDNGCLQSIPGILQIQSGQTVEVVSSGYYIIWRSGADYLSNAR